MSQLISAEAWAEHRAAVRQELPEVLAGEDLPAVLLPYQQQLLATTAINQVTLCEKSRRIGATWGVAADAVLTAGAQKTAGGMDVLYIGYNLDMAGEFIDTCAMWARAFVQAASAVEEFLFTDQDKGKETQIRAYRIGFASGFEIVALASRPRSLRGRQGYVIVDEAAFHDDLDELLKAALALLIWGGKVLVISTHDGVDNPFNRLIEAVRKGEKPYAIVRCTFDEALEQGLYQRICLVRGEEWSPEAEAAWRAKIRAFYGAGAAEELDCVPARGGGVYLPLALIERAMSAELAFVAWRPPEDMVDWPEVRRHRETDQWCGDVLLPVLERLPQTRAHCFGEDFGREVDRTDIATVYTDRDLSRIYPLIVELARTPVDVQMRVMRFIVQRLPRFSHGVLDANGNGMAMAEHARQTFGTPRITELKATEDWYREVMPPFKKAFEDDQIRLPAHVDVQDDLRMIQLVHGVARIPRSQRRDGSDGQPRHGDAAMAIVHGFAATRADTIAYGYEAAPRGRPFDEGRGRDDNGPFGRREPDPMGGRLRFGRGAW